MPATEFVLPTASVHVLCHPDFLARDANVVTAADLESRLIQFRSGPLTLITTTLEGNFPGYRHVIPRQLTPPSPSPKSASQRSSPGCARCADNPTA